MRGINKVTLVGTLGKDPEIFNTQAGSCIANVSVATNESWKDKQTGEKKERTEWHRVKAFGRLAEIMGEYLNKGSQVYIEGSLRTEKYTDKAGVEKYSTDIIASEMMMLGGKRDRDDDGRKEPGPSQDELAQRAKAPQGQPAKGRSTAAKQYASRDDADDDLIPF